MYCVSSNFAASYCAVRRVDDACALLKETHKRCEEAMSPTHTLTIQVRENFEALEDEMNQPPAPSPESSEE